MSLASFNNNPIARRLDPRAFWHSHQLFENRRVQLELHGSARDEQTGKLFLTYAALSPLFG